MFTFGLAVFKKTALPLFGIPAEVEQAPQETVRVPLVANPVPVSDTSFYDTLGDQTVAKTPVVSGVEKPLGIPPIGFEFTAVEKPAQEHVFGLTEDDRLAQELQSLQTPDVYGHQATFKLPDQGAASAPVAVEATSVVKTVQKAMRKGAKLTVVANPVVETPVKEPTEPLFDFSAMSVEKFEERSRTSLPYALFQEEWGCEDNRFEGLMSNLPVDFVNMRMGGELETHHVATSTGVCSQFRTIAPKGITLVVSLYPNGDRTVCFEATDKPGEITLIRYP